MRFRSRAFFVCGWDNSTFSIQQFIIPEGKTDHLGSTRTVVNTSGTAVAYFDFYPFGKLMPGRFTSSNDDRYKFTGHELDEEAGLDLSYAGARYLDSEIGTWLSVDPMEEFASSYSYVGGNPLNLIDPTGMSSESWSVHFEPCENGKACIVMDQGDTVYDLLNFLSIHNIDINSLRPSGGTGGLFDENGDAIPGASVRTNKAYVNVVKPMTGIPPLPGGVIKNPKDLLKGWTWVKSLFTNKKALGTKIGLLREAAKKKGNFDMGSATRKEAIRLGKMWVGKGYRFMSDGKGLVSADGLKTFRFPTFKPKKGVVQANFEWKTIAGTKPVGNGHIKIVN